jgi:Cu/Ag efflux pump CusA
VGTPAGAVHSPLQGALATWEDLCWLPLAVKSGEPGNEIEGPMATVILGGLITSTILNLLVLATLSLRYGRFTRTTPTPEVN